MFNLFSSSKRVVGLELRPGKIRFVEILRSGGFDRVTAYGTADVAGDGLYGSTLRTALTDLKKVLKTNRVHVSIPENEESEAYKKVLRSIGFRVEKFVPVGTALDACTIPRGSDTSFIVVEAGADRVDFLVHDPLSAPAHYVSDPASHAVISNLNRIYIDWYDAHKEKIDHVIFCGEKAGGHEFLSYVSRELKLPIHRANVFANLDLDPAIVPIMTREESYKYAVAIGLALS